MGHKNIVRRKDEATVKKVLEAAGAKVDDARVKALVASLEGVNIDEAIEIAAELAELAPDSYGTRYIRQQLSPGQQFVVDLLTMAGNFGVDPSAFARTESSVERIAIRVESLLAEASRFNDPQGRYYHCFCNFEQ